jgi:hypothetical protein
MTKAKNPKYLKPQEGLSATQRKSLGLEKTAPRQRMPGEAMPTTICNSMSRDTYHTGDGDFASTTMRPGASDAFKLQSRGIRA